MPYLPPNALTMLGLPQGMQPQGPPMAQQGAPAQPGQSGQPPGGGAGMIDPRIFQGQGQGMPSPAGLQMGGGGVALPPGFPGNQGGGMPQQGGPPPGGGFSQVGGMGSSAAPPPTNPTLAQISAGQADPFRQALMGALQNQNLTPQMMQQFIGNKDLATTSQGLFPFDAQQKYGYVGDAPSYPYQKIDTKPWQQQMDFYGTASSNEAIARVRAKQAAGQPLDAIEQQIWTQQLGGGAGAAPAPAPTAAPAAPAAAPAAPTGFTGTQGLLGSGDPSMDAWRRQMMGG